MIRAAVVLIALLIGSGRAFSADILAGEWATQGYVARVRIDRCFDVPNALCGTITWLWETLDSQGMPMPDAKNPSPQLRTRPLLSLVLLRNFRSDGIDRWSGGEIYNPENGRTYSATLRLRTNDILEVKGCVLFVCQTQIWRRARSVCGDGS